MVDEERQGPLEKSERQKLVARIASTRSGSAWMRKVDRIGTDVWKAERKESEDGEDETSS